MKDIATTLLDYIKQLSLLASGSLVALAGPVLAKSDERVRLRLQDRESILIMVAAGMCSGLALILQFIIMRRVAFWWNTNADLPGTPAVNLFAPQLEPMYDALFFCTLSGLILTLLYYVNILSQERQKK
jgi:hypothetical protein